MKVRLVKIVEEIKNLNNGEYTTLFKFQEVLILSVKEKTIEQKTDVEANFY